VRVYRAPLFLRLAAYEFSRQLPRAHKQGLEALHKKSPIGSKEDRCERLRSALVRVAS